eukprot:1195525-Prorocentrum_minimum.AAC.9
MCLRRALPRLHNSSATAPLREEGRRVYSHDGPIGRRKRGYILTTDQSDAGSTVIFSQRTNRTQEAQVYSHDGPISGPIAHLVGVVAVGAGEHLRGPVLFLEPRVAPLTRAVLLIELLMRVVGQVGTQPLKQRQRALRRVLQEDRVLQPAAPPSVRGKRMIVLDFNLGPPVPKTARVHEY